MAAYSTQWGEIAATLLAEGIPVLQDPAQAPWTPDVIHGHHQWETTVAALRWHDRPVLSFCRGIESWHEAACHAPNVVRWVAIDEPCAQRLILEEKVPADKVSLVLNGIDVERFQVRAPLPEHPHSALLFSNYATPERLLPEVVKACGDEGLQCEAIGSGVHRIVDRPEEMLGQFDIVFAKGKAALEAIFTGCAVIVCDVKGLGPLVTADNFLELRKQSFGYPCMTDPLTPEGIRERIRQWNPESSMRAQAMARETCRITDMFDGMEALYRQAAATPVTSDLTTWMDFSAAFLALQGSNGKLGRELRDLHRHASKTEGSSDPFEVCREHHRIRDAYRKGQSAKTELKGLKKSLARSTTPAVSKPRRGFMGLFN